jgi:hypothetical protein
MNDSEKKELIRLCHRYAANIKLPDGPLRTSRQELAEWVSKAKTLPATDDEADDGWFEVYNLIQHAPDDAWAIIRDLLRETSDEGEAGAIGAGILETFVREHGSGWVDEIDQEMRSNPWFASAMRNVRGIYRHPELDTRISDLLNSE